MLFRFYICIFSLFCVCNLFSNALPTSLLENTKTLNIHASKVKRTSDSNLYRNGYLEESVADSPYYNKPSAKKRGGTGRQNLDLSLDIPDWNSDSELYEKHASHDSSMRKINSELYPRIDDSLDEKHLDNYEKNLNYGPNKDKFENAISKSEFYGEPMTLSQYRYYGRDDKRRKRNISPYITRLNSRLKREIDGNPEDDLFDLISLWEAEHKYNRNPSWRHNTFPNAPEYGQISDDLDDSDDEVEETDENWLETPVYPTARNTGRLSPATHIINAQSPYYYQTKDTSYQPMYTRRPWFGEKTKRFMVTRKRRDPTRELRYFTGPADMTHDRDDNIYTLAQLLSGVQQRDPNVPLYHRAIL